MRCFPHHWVVVYLQPLQPDSAFDTFLGDILTSKKNDLPQNLSFEIRSGRRSECVVQHHQSRPRWDGDVRHIRGKNEILRFLWAGFLVKDLIEQADESKPRLTSLKRRTAFHCCQPLIMNSRWHLQQIVQRHHHRHFARSEIDDLFSGDRHLDEVANWCR